MLIFSLDELLVELGIVENTLRARIKDDGFPHPRKMGTGNKIFWLVSDVVEWLQNCPRAWGGEDASL